MRVPLSEAGIVGTATRNGSHAPCQRRSDSHASSTPRPDAPDDPRYGYYGEHLPRPPHRDKPVVLLTRQELHSVCVVRGGQIPPETPHSAHCMGPGSESAHRGGDREARNGEGHPEPRKPRGPLESCAPRQDHTRDKCHDSERKKQQPRHDITVVVSLPAEASNALENLSRQFGTNTQYGIADSGSAYGTSTDCCRHPTSPNSSRCRFGKRAHAGMGMPGLIPDAFVAGFGRCQAGLPRGAEAGGCLKASTRVREPHQ
jgi:hypothetical protein